MSVDHLKKQAKNLKAALPAFIQDHPTGAAPLSAFQELVAGINGYPSWHAAVASRGSGSEALASSSAASTVDIVLGIEYRDIVDYPSDGSTQPSRQVKCAVLQPVDEEKHAEADSALFSFTSLKGDLDEFGQKGPPQDFCVDLAQHCRKVLAIDPNFIHAYAELCSALLWLKRFEEAIEVAQPVFDQLKRQLPRHFSGRIPYYSQENRPLHQLAHALVRCYFGLQTEQGNQKAVQIATQMLKWWPQDNAGFRFLLQPPSAE